MEAGSPRVTLDDPVLRDRLRREFITPSYVRRPVTRPQSTLLSDITSRRYPKHSTSPQTTTHQTPPSPEDTSVFSKLPAQATNATNATNATVAHTSTPTSLPARQSHSSTLMRSAVTKPTSKKRHLPLKHKGKSKLQLALIALAIGIVFAGGYVSLIGFRANHLVATQAVKLTAEANKAAVSTTSSKAPTPALSTVKPSVNTLANYVVAPNLPRYIIIPKLGVDARVLSVGVNSQGALETPDNVYDTAWYNESSEPGQPGAMLIDGHVSSWTAHGVFYGIKTLVAGDLIKIQRGDGTIFTYSVVSNQVFSSGNVNMQSAITPIVAGQPGLNLITCTGDVIPGTSLFNERIVVYATLQQ